MPPAAPSQQAYLRASNAETGDGFGFSVAVDGDTVVAGALQEDGNGTGEFSGPYWSAPAEGLSRPVDGLQVDGALSAP